MIRVRERMGRGEDTPPFLPPLPMTIWMGGELSILSSCYDQGLSCLHMDWAQEGIDGRGEISELSSMSNRTSHYERKGRGGLDEPG